MLVCIYCGEEIADEQLECCGENHFEEMDEEEFEDEY